MGRWEPKDLREHPLYGIGAFENKPLHYWPLSNALAAQADGHKLFISVVVPMGHEQRSFPDIVKVYHQQQFEQALSSNIS